MSDHPRKLIEVALPLDEINAACKADKDRKTGTIRNLHKWFAPMPLPAWRALLYAALIDDPDDDEERAYHLGVIKRLVANGADLPDPDVVMEARDNLLEQFPEGVPAVMDPFCGGGSTLVEAQRLGLTTFGSDLNPVPVLITRTLTELLPRVYGRQPLHPDSPESTPARKPRNDRNQASVEQDALINLASSTSAKSYEGYGGLISDVSHYAEQVRAKAWEQLKDYYPSRPGESPIAWLWARTARCPNPACGIQTLLATSWWLSKKNGDLAWIEPKVAQGQVELNVISGRSSGEAPKAPKSGRGAFECIACGVALTDAYLRAEGMAQRLGQQMTAVVVEGAGGRTYRSASVNDVAAASRCSSPDFRDIPLTGFSRDIRPNIYGILTWGGLYTDRQLLTLSVFADLIAGLHEVIIRDGGTEEWADAIVTALGLALGKLAQYNSMQCRWLLRPTAHAKAVSAFDRADIPMMWDFAETAFTTDSVGGWMLQVKTSVRALEFAANGIGKVTRGDARAARMDRPGLIATDPPYFDAIGYADLSDYFYVWHRRALKHVHPDLYSTTAAPKHGELTAIPSHHGNDKDAARDYFIEGFASTFTNLRASMDSGLPMIVVYASKEQKAGSGEETRWAAILTAIIQAELEITGTWPIHGTTSARMIGIGANAVATYVAMVCRPRRQDAGVCTLVDFNRALRRELKPAVERLQAAGILPVDLAQAAMGPGMQVYSRYRAVLDQAGEPVPVDQALRLINQALTEVLDEQEGELDPASRFAVTLWEKHHWGDVPFGEADQVARPQGIAVDDVIRSHVASFPRAGFVNILGQGNLDRSWSPKADARPTAWEAVHHLADRLIDGGGVTEAGALMAELGVWRDQAQALVYRLHAIAARKGWTEDQERYNALIGSWSDLLAEAGRVHDNGDGLF